MMNMLIAAHIVKSMLLPSSSTLRFTGYGTETRYILFWGLSVHNIEVQHVLGGNHQCNGIVETFHCTGVHHVLLTGHSFPATILINIYIYIYIYIFVNHMNVWIEIE